jgi:hypothetical protein
MSYLQTGLIGTWRTLSWTQTGEVSDTLGERPPGYIDYSRKAA